DRRVAGPDRAGPAAGAQDRLAHGHRGEQGRPHRDLGHQGRHPGDGRVGDRQSDPGAWRGRCQPGLPARPPVGLRPHAAVRRRPGRGAQALAGAPRTAPLPLMTGQKENQQMPTDSSRAAIVTGAARGIGAATAKRLAADGMAIAAPRLDAGTCTETVDAITTAGGRAVAVGADVSDAGQVETAVGKVAAELGPPVVLVNNAGIIRDNLLFKMSEDDWDMVLGVHLRGAFLMTRAAQKFMVDQRFGRIVNLSSSSALGNRGQVNYSAAKAGLQGFTKALAIELGQFGVTANAVAPGFIATD